MADFLQLCFSVVIVAICIVIAIGLVYLIIGISPIILLLLVIGAIIYAIWKIIQKILKSFKNKVL